jgi:hypothetical protein
VVVAPGAQQAWGTVNWVDGLRPSSIVLGHWLPTELRGDLKVAALPTFTGSSQSGVYLQPETTGFEQGPDDVVGEAAEGEGGAAEVPR